MASSRYFLILAVFLLSIDLVLATGISGSNLNAKVRFEPNMNYGFSYSLKSESYDNSYSLMARGDLAQYVHFEKDRLENIATGDNVPINGMIELPAELEPGWRRAEICVIEDCRNAGGMCGRTGACAAVNFQVLYNGIMPVLKSFVGHNINEDQPITFTATIDNLGKVNITSVTGDVEVFNKQEQSVGIAHFNNIWIAGGTVGVITAVFESTGLQSADYFAKANILADNIVLTGNTSFKIGVLDVKITDYTKELTTGGIKRFLVGVESVWNDPVPVYADVSIYDHNTSVSSRSATATLLPWGTADLESYMDTSTLQEKEYNLHIELSYGDKMKSVDDKIMLVKGKELEPEIIEKVTLVETPQNNMMMLMTVVLIVIVLILTLLNIFLIFKKKKDGDS